MPRNNMTASEVARTVVSMGEAPQQDTERRTHCWVCHHPIEYNESDRIIGHESCEGSVFSPCTIRCGFATDPNNPANDPEFQRNNYRDWSVGIDEALQSADQIIDIPNGFFEGFAFDPFTNRKRKIKKVEKPKTMEEELKEFTEQLKETPKEEIELRIKYYVEDRDEKLLRKILEETRGLRTYYDIRCFINDYIFRNK